MRRSSITALIGLLALTAGCAGGSEGDRAASPEGLRDLDPPTDAASAQPNLFAAGDRLYLSWLEHLGGKHGRLRFSVFQNGGWSAPRTVFDGQAMFLNWADFPSLVELADGTLVAHWLNRSGESTYAYRVELATSDDGGESWSAPLVAHDDTSATQHGFVTLLPDDRGGLDLIWLDGRATLHGGDRMQLLHRRLLGGQLGPESVLDEYVCTCCQTSACASDGDVEVVYRDADSGVRDIAHLSLADPSAATILYRDGWEIAGCPVNGPAIAYDGEGTAAAWYTEGSGAGQVLFLRPERQRTPTRIDLGRPLGNVHVVGDGEGSAWIGWLERRDDIAELLARRIDADGRLGAPVQLARTAASRRAVGFPRLARIGRTVYAAWTSNPSGGPSRVRVVAFPI